MRKLLITHSNSQFICPLFSPALSKSVSLRSFFPSTESLFLILVTLFSNLKKAITDYNKENYIEWVLDHSGQVVIAVVRRQFSFVFKMN